MSRTPRASATRPATCPVSAGLPWPKAEESATGWVIPVLACGCRPGDGSGVEDGTIAGNRPDALLAPMSCPVGELMAGADAAPSGRAFSAGVIAVDLAGVAEAGGEVAAVTPTVSVAAGGVQAAVVVTLAVAVSFTDVTEEAPDATGTCASTDTAFVSATEPTAHFAVPSPVPQPVVNVGFTLDGCVPSAMDTPEADPFSVETCTVKEAF